MILVSQTSFLHHNIAIAEDTVLRVNCAWVKSVQELKSILDRLGSFQIFLDLPTGRSKPPIPSLNLTQVSAVVEQYSCVKYFGLTNTICISQIQDCREELPSHIKIVPKIESLDGVEVLSEICQALTEDEKYLMLDKEDLYTDVRGVIRTYELLISKVKDIAKQNNKIVLELQGVIFAERK